MQLLDGIRGLGRGCNRRGANRKYSFTTSIIIRRIRRAVPFRALARAMQPSFRTYSSILDWRECRRRRATISPFRKRWQLTGRTLPRLATQTVSVCRSGLSSMERKDKQCTSLRIPTLPPSITRTDSKRSIVILHGVGPNLQRVLRPEWQFTDPYLAELARFALGAQSVKSSSG